MHNSTTDMTYTPYDIPNRYSLLQKYLYFPNVSKTTSNYTPTINILSSPGWGRFLKIVAPHRTFCRPNQRNRQLFHQRKFSSAWCAFYYAIRECLSGYTFTVGQLFCFFIVERITKRRYGVEWKYTDVGTKLVRVIGIFSLFFFRIAWSIDDEEAFP